MQIMNKIIYIGIKIIEFLIEIKYSFILIKNCLLSINIPKKDIKNFIKNIYFIGFLSLGIIKLSAVFIGMVVGLQGYNILKKFGTEEVIGHMTALTIIRELGPVVSALLFTGRTGTALTAEICLMKSTEQLLAIEMMGINTIKKIIAPKFFAVVISMVILAMVFIIVAIFGSYISTVCWLGVDGNAFWTNIKENIDFRLDIINSLIKSFVFGFIIAWVSVFQGVISKPTVEGIAEATTNTVVYSAFIILSLNFILTSIMF